MVAGVLTARWCVSDAPTLVVVLPSVDGRLDCLFRGCHIEKKVFVSRVKENRVEERESFRKKEESGSLISQQNVSKGIYAMDLPVLIFIYSFIYSIYFFSTYTRFY